MSVFIIMGGGILDDGTLPTHVKQRVDYVISSQKKHDSIIFSSLFSLNITPFFDEDGFPSAEAKKMKEYYLKETSSKGRSKTFLEIGSFDTVGAAFFSRKIFDFVVKNEEITVVTSDFHRPRTEYLFKKIWALEPELPIKSMAVIGLHTATEFFCDRKERESLSLEKTKNQIENIQSISEFSHWMFSRHTNYSSFLSDSRIKRGEYNAYRY